MKKYTILEGANQFESESRNVKKHIQEGGYNKVTIIESKTGKFICEGIRYADGKISIRTEENYEDKLREKEWKNWKMK